MKNIAPLQQQAIEAAKSQDWSLAINLNQDILNEDPKNVGALNRLALAKMQIGQLKEAKQYLNQVLELDKHNKVALRNLEKAKKRKKGKIAQFNHSSSYIEEPGKAKIISLIRIPDTKVLDNLTVGESCLLEPKKSLVSVILSSSQNYIGSLPQDISSRLIRLIKQGNQYQCIIHSVEPEENVCKVHIQETYVSEKNQGITSFPISNVQSDLLDPELLSIEHKLKNDLPIEYFDEEDGDDDIEKIKETESDEELSDDPLEDDED
ncbi:MAG: TPR repeat-containing protein [Microgenomates bacterium 39_7]|nr:MAG: TPR repeat-containing protein [Microgenomates bacterium 39_7]